MPLRRVFFLTALLGSSLSVFGQTPQRLVQLPIDVPSDSLHAFPAGELADSTVLHLSICLPYRDPAGMQAFVDSVSDPKSSMYRHWLTPAQIGARFGQTTATVQKLTSYLTANGMKINLVADNRLSILADATVAQAETAFNTTIESYLNPANPLSGSGSYFSYTTNPSVPAELSPFISYIGGMENFTRPKPMTDYYVTPVQLRTFYNAQPIYAAGQTGTGRTIAISNYDGFRLADLPNPGWYNSGGYGLWQLAIPSGGVGSNVSEEIPSGDVTGTTAATGGEGDLDIQCILGQAPTCNLIIYTGLASGGGGDPIGVLTLESNDNKADILTESYGWRGNSAFYSAAHNLHVSMSGQGMTYFCASGDAGTADLNYTSGTPYPDMDPEITTVGGTSTYTSSQGGSLSSTTGWSNTVSGQIQGSGGGWTVSTDSFNTLPSWQKGTGVPTNVPYRLVPDIASNADDINSPCMLYLVNGDAGSGQNNLYYGFGGTSEASPTTAGDLALAEQQIIVNGGLPANGSGKQRFGRINDLLYSFNGNSSVFTDITTGSTTGNLPNGSAAVDATGWDFVTGWGVVNFQGLVTAESVKVTHVSVNPTSVEGGNGASTGTVTISGNAPAGGLSVSLSSNITGAVVPATVTVAAGATTATFTITTNVVGGPTTATITASTSVGSATATLALTAPKVISLALNPTTVVGGNTSTATITIDLAAPTGGLSVSSLLSSNTSVATVPTRCVIAAGQTTGTFTVTTLGVAAKSTSSISAASGGATGSATITTTAAEYVSITRSPASFVCGATNVTGTVSLNGAAPPGGVTVTLGSSNTSVATVPSSVNITGTSASFPVTSYGVSANTAVTLSGTVGSITRTIGITVETPALAYITFSPNNTPGTLTATGYVEIASVAPTGGITIALSTTSAVVSVPATCTVAAGSKLVSFTATTSAVNTSTSATVTAKLGSSTKTGTLVVNPPSPLSITRSPASLVGGGTATGTVTLNVPPATSISVALTSSNTAAVTVPATISVSGTTANFTITTHGVSTNTVVTLSAKANGVTRTIGITVEPPAITFVTLSPTSVVGGGTVTGTVGIATAAPTGGISVPLASANTSVATVPATVTIPAGATSATFTVTTSAVGTTTTVAISATMSNTHSATLTVKS